MWQKSQAKEHQVKEFTGITASPLIEDQLLILYLCGKPAACVVAFDKNSGKEVWRALDDSFTCSSPIIVTAGGKHPTRATGLWRTRPSPVASRRSIPA